MILLNGAKQFLFTYKHKTIYENSTILSKVVDYRYLTLGSAYKYTSKLFGQPEGTPQHEIQTIKGVIKNIEASDKANDKLKIEI